MFHNERPRSNRKSAHVTGGKISTGQTVAQGISVNIGCKPDTLCWSFFLWFWCSEQIVKLFTLENWQISSNVVRVSSCVLEMLTVQRLCNDFPDLEVSSGIFVEDPRFSVQEIYNKLT